MASNNVVVFTCLHENGSDADTFTLYAVEDEGTDYDDVWQFDYGETEGDLAFGPGHTIYRVGEDTLSCITDGDRGSPDGGGMGFTDNMRPDALSNPVPENEAIDQEYSSLTISWNCSDPDGHSLKYSVFIRAAGAEDMIPVVVDLSDTSYTLTDLSPDTTYVWRVIATDGQALTEGPTWTFETLASSPESGLVAHFPFDGDVQEVTGYSNDGANYGSTGTEDRFGEPNGARHFTNRQYVRVPRSAAIEPADAITVALWARLTDPNARELPILSKRYNVDSPLCNSYILQPNNAPDFNMVGAIIVGGSVVPAASSTAMEPYVWTHAALVYDGASLKVYQDGQLVAQCPATGDLDYSSDDLYIGMATPKRSEQHWEGDIDDVRIYNRALSASEVQELSGRTLDIGGAIYRNIDDVLGSGLDGATVTVSGDNGVYEAVTSGAAGLWQISDVNEGTYTVVPSKTGWEFEHVLAGVPDGQSSTVIEVNDANEAANQSIQFVAEAEVGAALHDWNGDGIVSIVGDVPPFVQCVYFGNCPDGVGMIAVGDCNGDGILSIVGDVPCFVQCVYFNNCLE